MLPAATRCGSTPATTRQRANQPMGAKEVGSHVCCGLIQRMLRKQHASHACAYDECEKDARACGLRQAEGLVLQVAYSKFCCECLSMAIRYMAATRVVAACQYAFLCGGSAQIEPV